MKNEGLKGITGIMAIVALISILSMETESTAAIIACALSLAWISLFAFSNGWFESREHKWQ